LFIKADGHCLNQKVNMNSCLQAKDFGAVDSEKARLRSKVYDLLKSGTAVYLHLGFAYNVLNNFINLDIRLHVKDGSSSIPKSLHDRVFIYPFAESPFPLPDNSVDFCFHEDFFEHLTQNNSTRFLRTSVVF
jgi:hypothetical protein